MNKQEWYRAYSRARWENRAGVTNLDVLHLAFGISLKSDNSAFAKMDFIRWMRNTNKSDRKSMIGYRSRAFPLTHKREFKRA